MNCLLFNRLYISNKFYYNLTRERKRNKMHLTNNNNNKKKSMIVS